MRYLQFFDGNLLPTRGNRRNQNEESLGPRGECEIGCMFVARFGSLSLAEWKPGAKRKRMKFAV